MGTMHLTPANAYLLLHAQARTYLHTQADAVGTVGSAGRGRIRSPLIPTLCILANPSTLGAEVSVGAFIRWALGEAEP